MPVAFKTALERQFDAYLKFVFSSVLIFTDCSVTKSKLLIRAFFYTVTNQNRSELLEIGILPV